MLYINLKMYCCNMRSFFLMISIAFFLAIILIAISWGKADNNYDALITIDANSQSAAMSDDMYGIFFEDINHATDGGLYAELIQNRDFESNRAPEGMNWQNDFSVVSKSGNWKERYNKPEPLSSWSIKTSGSSNATMKQTDESPLNSNNPMSLELNVQSLKSGKVSILNSGFWGVNVKKGEHYRLSLYAHKNNEYVGGVKVSLEGTNGKEYASVTIKGINKNWQQFKTDLTSSSSDSNARFVIHPQSTGKLWFDVVSLFPSKTYNNRSNGMRNDLATMLENLHPSFLRFPGGCVVEGATLSNRFQWKKTIGDLAYRPGNWNLWRYHTTDGIGFHEYLQLCEDLHAAPMYVVNVGMACQARSSQCIKIGEVQDFIDDTYDALEYAMGAPNSKWGRLRAKNGHPTPFKIKYLEIGNENRGQYYQEVYKAFYTAIKNKYPDIITIADEPITFTKSDKAKYPKAAVEIVDDHYYKSPLFFYNHENYYDDYKGKNSPKIYIGEFAVNTPDGGMGNLRAALGEAVFMIGMERNADKVIMASYAPTFLNYNDQRWVPDMIVYDNNKVYGTPSYYGLQMFSNNRPQYVLQTKVVNNKRENENASHEYMKGGFGFNNRGGKILYKDIKVVLNGRNVMNDAENKGLDKWMIKADNWEYKNGVLTNKFDEIKSNIMFVRNDWKDYSLQMKVQMLLGEGGIHLYFLNGGGGLCALNMAENNFNLTQQTGDGKQEVLKKTNEKLETGKWYDIKIDINNGNLKCFINDNLFGDVTLKGLSQYSVVYSTSGIDNKNNEIIVKLVNPSKTEKVCKLIINGKSLMSKAKAFLLTSKSQNDENSLQHPGNIKPQLIQLNNVSSSFNYKSPAGSISVLRLKVRR
jgi:alpha-L-arabinofuranosidase